MTSNENYDLSTPEGRIERGIYDAEIDQYITDEQRARHAGYIALHPEFVDEKTSSSRTEETISII